MIKVFFILNIFCVGCKTDHKINKDKKETIEVSKTDYNFTDFQKLELETSLKEISGLSYFDGNIYTHNDEDGIVFKLDPDNGQIISTQKFGKKGDYEGIEVVSNQIIIASNNGDLVFFDMKTNESNIVKNKLKKENNIEGLGYYQVENKLLIACKGKMIKSKGDKEKAIYSFNLITNKLNDKPFLSISDKELKEQLNKQYANSSLSKKELKKRNSRAIEFSPSGIAVQPTTGDYYIISARGSLLVILNTQKEIKQIIFLNEKQLPQPEGICFDTNETLFISSEFKNGGGKIYKYKQHTDY